MGGFKSKVNSVVTAVSVKRKEQVFKQRLKYILEKFRGSDVLIVVFSGFPGNTSARYNYIRTLKEIEGNRLFILDDFGYEKKGAYYLGEDGDFYAEKMVVELVSSIKEKLGIKHIITAGSSKGGSSAIYFGLKLKADAIVAGAPQYYIGNYLNTEEHRPILDAIVGSRGGIECLNDLILNEIKNYDGDNTTIFLHYSTQEHTYQEHIKFLIADLKAANISLIEDVEQYKNHSDVALYFPVFLKKTIQECIELQENLNDHPDKC